MVERDFIEIRDLWGALDSEAWQPYFCAQRA